MKILSKFKDIDIKTMEINKKTISYFYHSDKVFFVYEVEQGSSILEDYKNFQSEISSPSNQDLIIKNLRLTHKDAEKYSHIDAFLWDLYFLIINISSQSKLTITPNEENKIERDKFIARKIVIQKESETEVEIELNSILYSDKIYLDLFANVQSSLKTDDVDILNSVLKSNANKIENTIKQTLNKTEVNLNDVKEYLLLKQEEFKTT